MTFPCRTCCLKSDLAFIYTLAITNNIKYHLGHTHSSPADVQRPLPLLPGYRNATVCSLSGTQWHHLIIPTPPRQTKEHKQTTKDSNMGVSCFPGSPFWAVLKDKRSVLFCRFPIVGGFAGKPKGTLPFGGSSTSDTPSLLIQTNGEPAHSAAPCSAGQTHQTPCPTKHQEKK